MTAALRALMTGLIDYAGFFPPAKLPLGDAVQEYLAIRKTPEAWMLGAFVIPAARLEELEPWFCESESPLPLAVIGDGGADLPKWQSRLDAVANSVAAFAWRFGDDVGRCTLEIPIAGQVHEDPNPDETIAQALQSISVSIPPTTHPITAVSLEVAPARDADAIRSSLIRACGHDGSGADSHVGFKLRTGGLKPETFPSAEQLAAVIRDCHEHRCRWKATAGLHHPIRHTDAELGVKVHGFLNVLFASVLADAHDVPESALCEIVADEDAASFQVTDNGIRWRDYSATIEQIDCSRQTTFQSFGSCSFDEPRDDLKELGLL